MKKIRTSWSKEIPVYGAFDDYVIIESTATNERFLIRPEEFEFLTARLFENFKKGKSNYIKLLKEWNECSGFNEGYEKPSVLLDIKETIEAIKLIEGVEKMEFALLTKADLEMLLDFLVKNENNSLIIWKE